MVKPFWGKIARLSTRRMRLLAKSLVAMLAIRQDASRRARVGETGTRKRETEGTTTRKGSGSVERQDAPDVVEGGSKKQTSGKIPLYT